MMTPEREVDFRDPHFEEAVKLLPAWFTSRMMTDQWVFGLLTVTGQVIVISCIESIIRAADGTLWLDVEMHQQSIGVADPIFREKGFFAPTSRTTASINANHIVAAFELADI